MYGLKKILLGHLSDINVPGQTFPRQEYIAACNKGTSIGSCLNSWPPTNGQTPFLEFIMSTNENPLGMCESFYMVTLDYQP